MAQMPTLGDFVQAATENHGAQLSGVESLGPRGQVAHRYLIREGKLAVLPEVEDDDVLAPTVVRSLCNRLGIDPGDFGLSLG